MHKFVVENFPYTLNHKLIRRQRKFNRQLARFIKKYNLETFLFSEVKNQFQPNLKLYSEHKKPKAIRKNNEYYYTH